MALGATANGMPSFLVSLQPALDNLNSRLHGEESAEARYKSEVTKGLLHIANEVLHTIKAGLH